MGPENATKGMMAEWSKALALGASPKGRGFEPHSYHYFLLHSYSQFFTVFVNHTDSDLRGVAMKTMNSQNLKLKTTSLIN